VFNLLKTIKLPKDLKVPHFKTLILSFKKLSKILPPSQYKSPLNTNSSKIPFIMKKKEKKVITEIIGGKENVDIKQKQIK